MILLIDNYDSFVYNLARYVGWLGKQRRVVRNDAVTLDEIALDPPEAIVISPGPCAPQGAGVCIDVIKHFGPRIPILGVCLGHQCIGEAYGGVTIRAPEPVHGRVSVISHNAQDLFIGLPNPLKAARYHSLVTHIPADTELEVTAETEDDRLLMGLRHKKYPVHGVQFHPESVLTENGIDMMRNFLMIADAWNIKHKRIAA